MAWRYLKKNDGNAIPRHVVFFDTETLPEPRTDDKRGELHRLRLGHAIAGRYEKGRLTRRRELSFTMPELFWTWAFRQCRRKHTLWIVAHNVLFDATQVRLWELFENKIVVLDKPRRKRHADDSNPKKSLANGIIVLEDPPTILGLRHVKSGGRIVIVDSLNWFKTPLSELGKSVGLPKLTMPAFSDSDETWIEYCRRDVEILQRTICGYFQFVLDEQMGVFRWTAASQAMSAFRHGRMDKQICTHDELDVKQLERASYFGGRVEVFKRGKLKERVYQLDATSLYPHLMRSKAFPAKLSKWSLAPDLIELRPNIPLERSIATVELDTPKVTFPLRRDTFVAYTLGMFTTTLCGPELEYADQLGVIRKWGAWSVYAVDDVFREFVESLWPLRCKYRDDGNHVYERYIKLILNSLVGKFGQLSPRWIELPGRVAADEWSTWAEYNMQTGVERHFRSIDRVVQEKQQRIETNSSFPAIAAFCCSYGRRHMDNLRDIAGRREVYYQGVDSLIVTERGLENLNKADQVADFELGKLRLQLSTDNGEIYGCGDYVLGDKSVHGGRKTNAIIGDDGKWQEQQFGGVSKLFGGRALDHIPVEIVGKSRTQNYRKGTVGADGWVEPHIVDNDSSTDWSETFSAWTKAAATLSTR